jgi:large conductance mechanosensitive channel
MSIIKEFKEFAVRGNVIDLAVAVIVGGAFGSITTSLVNDVIMPPIGLLLGGINFSEFAFVLREATADSAAISIRYGMFLQTVIDFTIIAFAVFMMIKAMNATKRKQEKEAADSTPPAEPVLSKEEQLLTEIRDLLKNK